MASELFVELSIILVITVVVTGLTRLLRQPAIIGYILSGIVAGPFVLDIVNSTDAFSTFSQQGVALLLFLVGLGLNPRVIKEVGKISLITGIGQVVFTTSVGFGIAKLLGFSTLASLYISFAFAFSSTIVIMKLLSDKKDLETLYGRISVGFLIVQDFIVILFLLVVSSLSAGGNTTTVAIETIFKGVGAVVMLFLLAVFILPGLTERIAKSQELLFLFSLGWCFAIASLFHLLNFSIEAGALLAGMTLSISPYHFEISAKMRPLRDFFLILFFVYMGSQMVFTSIADQIGSILIFSFFILIGNPIIVMILMGLLGYTKRNSFMAGLTVAQISEFSLIIIAMGVSVGQLGGELLSMATAVALITFAGSTYMILYSNKIYLHISRYLSIFEKHGKKVDSRTTTQAKSFPIILFGYNRIGYDILESLKKMKKKFLVIDYDPEVITSLARQNYTCQYGDASDSEFLDELNLDKSKMIISTISDIDTNLLLINKVRETNKKVIISVVANQIDDALKLYDQGATYVIMPHLLGGKHFSTMIGKHKLGINHFLKEKIAHIQNIKKRKRK